jgi:hypothetical protein
VVLPRDDRLVQLWRTGRLGRILFQDALLFVRRIGNHLDLGMALPRDDAE